MAIKLGDRVRIGFNAVRRNDQAPKGIEHYTAFETIELERDPETGQPEKSNSRQLVPLEGEIVEIVRSKGGTVYGVAVELGNVQPRIRHVPATLVRKIE